MSSDVDVVRANCSGEVLPFVSESGTCMRALVKGADCGEGSLVLVEKGLGKEKVTGVVGN